MIEIIMRFVLFGSSHREWGVEELPTDVSVNPWDDIVEKELRHG